MIASRNGVPETDNVQVTGVCDATRGIGFQSSSVTFGAEMIGDLENGKQVELRVSGGGFDHPLKGEIYRSTGEEGLNGLTSSTTIRSGPRWTRRNRSTISCRATEPQRS